MHTFGRIAVLAPAIVVALGMLAAVLILLGRAAAQSLQTHPHPRRIVALGVAGLALLLALGLLGIRLPQE